MKAMAAPMKKSLCTVLFLLFLMLCFAGCGSEQATGTNASLPSTASAQATAAVSPTPTALRTAPPAISASPEITASPSPAGSATPEEKPSPTYTPKPSPLLSPSPTPKPTPSPTQTLPPTENTDLPLKGFVIGLDPGHQAHGNSAKEPVAPDSDEMKKKVSSGTQGRWTKVPEYKVNLQVALLLKALLEERGATVVMTRETHNVNISNAERAQFFNEQNTDYALRLHCNGSDDPDIHGAFMLVPTKNPYLEDCNRAAALLIEEYCKATDAKNLGITKRSDQTGFNWCERMIVNIEMGHMTNKKEDYLLTDSDYQKKMAQGLLNGILRYFEPQTPVQTVDAFSIT